MVNRSLIRPYFWGGRYVRKGRLTGHNITFHHGVARLLILCAFTSHQLARARAPHLVNKNDEVDMQTFLEQFFWRSTN